MYIVQIDNNDKYQSTAILIFIWNALKGHYFAIIGFCVLSLNLSIFYTE